MEPPPILFPRDPVSSLTHLGAGVFSVYVALVLWRLSASNRTKRMSLLVFAGSAVLLYLVSGTYHGIPQPRSSPLVSTFRRLDHSAIYLLIAGTYTPVFAVLLHGRRRVVMLTLVWLLATAGIAAKWAAPLANERWTVGLYLAMGWLVVLTLRDLWRTAGWRGALWGAAGGVCYTTAAVCELIKWPVIVPSVFAWHETCHVLDMAGTAFHIVFMIQCVIPYRAPQGDFHDSANASDEKTAESAGVPCVAGANRLD